MEYFVLGYDESIVNIYIHIFWTIISLYFPGITTEYMTHQCSDLLADTLWQCFVMWHSELWLSYSLFYVDGSVQVSSQTSYS